MKVISILSVCFWALAGCVSANHGQFDHMSVAPAHDINRQSHNFGTRDARKPYRVYPARDAARYEYSHETATHDTMKPIVTHHFAREAEKPTRRPSHFEFEIEKPELEESKPTAAPGPANDEMPRKWFALKHEQAAAPEAAHTGGAVAAVLGHHFVRDASAGRPKGDPFTGTRFTPGFAVNSVRGILTGATGIKKTCDRCIAAMQVGQALAQQSSTEDFSSAVVGLCQQVAYKSKNACASSFGPSRVGPYIQTLQNANIQQDGKNFCKAYFNTC